ncbi:MAG: PilN domain-containing protein [Marinobacter sp.]
MIQQVNLYTAEFRPRPQRLTATSGLLVVLVALLLVLAAGGWYRYEAAELEQSVTAEGASNDRLLQSVEKLTSELQGRRPDAQLEGAVERVTDTLARRQRLLERVERLASNPSDGFSAPMSALARQVPEGLWLTGLSLRPDRVSLEGRTREGNLVPVYLERLGQEAAFTGQAFGRFELGRSDDHPWIEFSVATRPDGEAEQ